MTDFLLELRSEEIPARMQDRARDDLAKLFTAELGRAGIASGAITTYATPRRLALIARDLPIETQAVTEEIKGPRIAAPPQALEGFLRKTGLTRDQLTERDGILFAISEKPGRATTAVLAEAIPAIIRGFPWPKSMRWGDASVSTESLRWVRPLLGIVALFGEKIVDVEIAGITSGAATLGHRFHHPYQMTIGSAGDYCEKLRACHVIVDQDERRTLIRDRAVELATTAGLDLIADEGLVAENAGLTEWPVPLLGRFDEAYLDVPPEVIQLTARVNQKYFVCRDNKGDLTNAFICTANVDAADGGAKIVEGNRKVLAARLADAKFFYDTDLKVPLDRHADKLKDIVFHEKLGTVADKVDRVAKLARWLIEEGIVKSSPLAGRRASEAGGGGVGTGAAPAHTPLHHQPAADGRSPLAGKDLAALAERAARLAKADLVTGMVGEFPELQGIMGGYYAAAQGEDPQVAAAIRDHYKPVGQGDEVPTAPVTVAVSLADKLDTFVSFFAIDQRPTGSKDPFALRRSGIAIINLLVSNGIRHSLADLVREVRTTLIASLGMREAVVSIDDNVSSSAPVPVLPANAELTNFGTTYLVPWASESQVLVTVKGVSYPAYSRDFIEELGIASVTIQSLVDVVGNCVLYLGDRIAEAQKASGVRVDLIRSVLPKEFLRVDLLAMFMGQEPRTRGPGVADFRKRNWAASDDPVDILARVHALQSFIDTADGTNLLAGYKRAANILKKEGWDSETETPPKKPLSYTPENDEARLIAALDSAEPAAAHAIAREDFEGAMAALATLRAPIDAFFDTVTVNDPDPGKRAARLTLLARIRGAVHAVADFSKIEG